MPQDPIELFDKMYADYKANLKAIERAGSPSEVGAIENKTVGILQAMLETIGHGLGKVLQNTAQARRHSDYAPVKEENEQARRGSNNVGDSRGGDTAERPVTEGREQPSDTQAERDAEPTPDAGRTAGDDQSSVRAKQNSPKRNGKGKKSGGAAKRAAS